MQLSDYFRHLNYTEIPVSSNLWIIVYTRDIRLYIIKVTPFITMKKKCRAEEQQLTLHHRKPTSIGGSRHNKRNHSYVPRNQHQAWHTLFSNHTAQTICAIINEKFLDSDYQFVCVKKNTP